MAERTKPNRKVELGHDGDNIICPSSRSRGTFGLVPLPSGFQVLSLAYLHVHIIPSTYGGGHNTISQFKTKRAALRLLIDVFDSKLKWGALRLLRDG